MREKRKQRKIKKVVDKRGKPAIITLAVASVAHLVERHLAKVEVASSSLVTRSIVGAKFALLRRLFLPMAEKTSSARSLAPPLQIEPAHPRGVLRIRRAAEPPTAAQALGFDLVFLF